MMILSIYQVFIFIQISSLLSIKNILTNYTKNLTSIIFRNLILHISFVKSKHILLNLFTKKNNNDAHKFIIDDFFKSNFLIEQNKMRGLKFDYILQINKLLGLQHSHDTDTIIDVKLINDNLQWFESLRLVIEDDVAKRHDEVIRFSDNLQNINHIFSLFNSVNNKGPVSKLIIVKLIKKIYSSWSNSNFTPNTIYRKKIATSYKLTIHTTLWPYIKHNI